MMSVTGEDSCNADRPSFKKVLLEGLRDSFEASLAKELNELSLAEREKAYYDLHGVAGVVEERPAFIAKCLADLESEICKLEDNRKKAYEMAKKADPDYICCRGFRLKFLRAECFMPKNAANRLVGFLEEKLKLFGPKPLARELLLSDLNQDDMVLLRSGLFSTVPLRDSAGRVVTSMIPFFGGESTLEIRVRRTKGVECCGDLDILELLFGSPPFLMLNFLTNRCALRCMFFAYSPRMKKRKRRVAWAFS
jgi:hypothetical protein